MQNNDAPLTISANRGIYITANGAYFRTGWTNGSDNTTIDSIISGPGPLTQVNDSSTLVLANTGNTYTGVTTFGSTNANFGYSNGASWASITKLSNGGQPSSVGASSSNASNLVLGGGGATLTYTGAGDSTNRLFTLASNATFNASGTGPVIFNNTGAVAFSGGGAYTLTLGGNGPGVNTFAPSLNNDGSSSTTLAVNGSYWLLTGSNSFTGGPTVSGGTLGLGNPAAFGPATNVLTVASGGAVDSNGTNLAMNGLSDGGTTGATTTGVVTSLAGAAMLTLTDNTQAYGGTITGPVALTVNPGSGTYQVLSGNSSYTGGTTINGVLVALSAHALGSAGAAVTLNSGGVLILGGPNTTPLSFAQNLKVVGNSVLAFDSTDFPMQQGTWSGPVMLANGANLTVASIAISSTNASTSDLTISGPISGNGGLIKSGSTVLTISGTNNTYNGSTTIGGVLALAANNALPVTTSLVLGYNGSNGTLDLAGNSQQVAGLATDPSVVAASQVIGNSSLTSNATLIYDGAGGSTFGGTIQDTVGGGAQKTALTVAAGRLALSGNSTYTDPQRCTTAPLWRCWALAPWAIRPLRSSRAAFWTPRRPCRD